MWERYCRGVSAVVFVVDSAIPIPSNSNPDSDNKTDSTNPTDVWNIATEELHALIGRPALAGVPLLVLATKNDVAGAASVDEVIKVM